MSEELDQRQQVAEARANLYRFLAQLYLAPPTDELLARLAEEDFKQHLETVFESGGTALIRALAGYLDPDALRLEYDALFRVPGERYLCPYESVYRGRRVVDDQVVNGTVWGPYTAEVERLYALAGARLAQDLVELPDFIGLELLFMAYLCEQEAGAWAAGDGDLARRHLALQRHFLAQHLSRWLDGLCDEILARAKLDFYVGLAELSRAFLAADCADVQRWT